MMKWVRRLAAATLVCGALPLAGTAQAQAQDYPNRPIKVIIGFAAGGPTDVVMRVVAQHMTPLLGQSVLVENKTGANALIATEEVARATPDGYTLIFNSINHNVNPILKVDRVKYDPIKSFTPVTLVGKGPMLIVTSYDSPFNSLNDVIAKGKAQPGSISFGSAGYGGSAHLAGEMLKTKTGVPMVHVPFRGNGPALAEVMSGRVSFMFYPSVGIADQVAANRVKVLAVAATQRNPNFPNVPTTTELGLSGLESTAPWIGLLAPAGTPEPIVQKVAKAVNEAMAKPEVKERLQTLGLVAVGGSPADFAAFLKSDYEHWISVIKAAGVQPEK